MSRRDVAVVDLGYGDAGKGTMVDYLAREREATLIVRFNGGPQAAHNVVLPDGRSHTFSQLGSAMFLPHMRTLLSRFVVIEPYALLREVEHLRSIGVSINPHRLHISDRCLIIHPLNQVKNRIVERQRDSAAHGTCGIGFGDCVADSIDNAELPMRAADLRDRKRLNFKLEKLFERKRKELVELREFASADELKMLDDPSWIATALDVYADVERIATIAIDEDNSLMIRGSQPIIFEGAQGVLLDEQFGEQPHTTWSRTTFQNALALAAEASLDPPLKIGVMRTYLTRHGNGPFVEFEPSISEQLSESHNVDIGWQGRFRRGPLDFDRLRYSIRCCGGIDSIALTHLDRLAIVAPGMTERDFIRRIEAELNTPVMFRSHGPTLLDKSTIGRSDQNS